MTAEPQAYGLGFCRGGTRLGALRVFAPLRPSVIWCAFALVVAPELSGCAKHERERSVPSAGPVLAASLEPPPRLLYLPDAAAPAGETTVPVMPRQVAGAFCPPDMVTVRSMFCIDRYEASLVDGESRRPLSPYYHPTPEATRREYERWQHLRIDLLSLF